MDYLVQMLIPHFTCKQSIGRFYFVLGFRKMTIIWQYQSIPREYELVCTYTLYKSLCILLNRSCDYEYTSQ